ncbi:uncharacterized protein SCHCODRAFT_02563510 [Schizophyllum commune H4-8]|uniref:Mitochondrial distribution and morphology protein 12 n=1 Tax=Schizophyllum commune (strain H4-8 / FGSC 9210) TaxID=578458 RepID=D8PUU3_SCHCM|nr:uncharacterized protein SCHCODRAFT_02563510 [Schizophyllum commune H4-8]KAI5900617.1 hypothetical protein SCHCODRAFT_02563510 [Schizophyllum commune H4-8]
MSIDLDWEKLNRGLAQHLVDVLNRQLASTETPSFIGPVQVCSLDFGSAAPDVELVDLRDIYRDFLEDDEDTPDDKDVKVTETDPIDDEDGYEWVSRQPPIRRSSSTESLDTRPDTSPPEPPQPAAQPNLQLHLYVTWNSDLRITLTTSLLINYPSPSFMSLPIKLSVTGLVFNGEVAVAYEGERRRIHLCILDDLDPYGPATAKRRDPTPPELLMDESEPITPSRLLPSIVIESEIGQADKHVLRNVTRVEKFIQDMIRKTVEEELVFPNFHTLVMGDG